LLDKVNGRPLGAGEDLVFDSEGGIYFTDPGANPRDGRPGHVYYLKPDRKDVVSVDDQLKFPNAIALSHDGKTLIVGETSGTRLWAYDVQSDGGVKNKHVFATYPHLAKGVSNGDGICQDSEDRVYASSTAGMEVFDRSGAYLGLIQVPNKTPSSCAFSGPDRKTLYVTARKALYRYAMEARGPNRPGK